MSQRFSAWIVLVVIVVSLLKLMHAEEVYADWWQRPTDGGIAVTRPPFPTISRGVLASEPTQPPAVPTSKPTAVPTAQPTAPPVGGLPQPTATPTPRPSDGGTTASSGGDGGTSDSSSTIAAKVETANPVVQIKGLSSTSAGDYNLADMVRLVGLWCFLLYLKSKLEAVRLLETAR